ncbi:DUF7472 family protein [Halosimplex salinum]|uniref:DUF7472 family protein n=1 Tax=Halosimplex salinum TaxID=1710538 RepID=UPI000F485F3B|nr:hypothetical protein [Halosimplex salinum]
MEIDRKLVAELAVSAISVVLFVGAAYVVSQNYAIPGNGAGNGSVSPALQPEGGLAMVGVIGLFVLLMAVAGLIMYRADFDGE